MQSSKIASIAVATTIIAFAANVIGDAIDDVPPRLAAWVDAADADLSGSPASFSDRLREPVLLARGEIDVDLLARKQLYIEQRDTAGYGERGDVPVLNDKPGAEPLGRPSTGKPGYLAFYPYAEIPLKEKPAEIVLAALKDVPVGTPVEEIQRATDAFGLDIKFMKAVARIESDFDPKKRTGSYIGLFQLSNYEFARYGSGEITNPRDNAIAAAYKFLTEATQFEWDTHRAPTFSDLYLIHQQGWQGAAEHVAHPERIAWKSMCATDEGKEKGEKWCKRAIWGNTLPAVKQSAKSVENLTSGEFVNMWRRRVDFLYARYSNAAN
jgi:hypothetical protein